MPELPCRTRSIDAFETRQWIEILNERHPDALGGKVPYLVSETSLDRVCKEFAWEDAVFQNLEVFAIAIEGRAKCPFTSEHMVRNVELLGANTRSAENHCSVEITEDA